MVIQSATTDNSYLDNKKLDAIFLIYWLISNFFLQKKPKFRSFEKCHNLIHLALFDKVTLIQLQTKILSSSFKPDQN